MHDLTNCVHHPDVRQDGFASLAVPTHRASTIVFPTAQAYANRHSLGADGYSYGLYGTPTTRTLEAQLTNLHKGFGTLLYPSGQAAISSVFLTLLRPGQHVLVPASAYPPVLALCRHLIEFGISHTVYDPLCGVGVSGLFRPETKLVWVESPGSTSLEVQDIPAIATAAHAEGILVGCDNTWASPLLCKPLSLGADFVVEALTKYAGGHSDVLMGSVTVGTEPHHGLIRHTSRTYGTGVSPDDCMLVLRGLETLGVRLARVGDVAFRIARQLERSPAADEVLHPALPHHPGHEAFQRDFAGSSGLFSVGLAPSLEQAVPHALGDLKVFKIGASWGGTRSLLAPITVASSDPSHLPRTYLRISIGLEDVDDLWDDLNRVFFHLEQHLLDPDTNKTVTAERN